MYPHRPADRKGWRTTSERRRLDRKTRQPLSAFHVSVFNWKHNAQYPRGVLERAECIGRTTSSQSMLAVGLPQPVALTLTAAQRVQGQCSSYEIESPFFHRCALRPNYFH
ncbi:hypothetical protein Nepgr_032466 [Nepenthes gracilis]|uniref:Uncharacterized protein n=1 Tax=Nepenthes gracilis TaxID=150966 RepID=A0AAD3TKH7_NEPGR|nr:hypothetical protein Nepgr_032466 [Nepenthes gracilis]